MDKTRYKILFSLEPSNRNTAVRSLPTQRAREREREGRGRKEGKNQVQERNRTEPGPSYSPFVRHASGLGFRAVAGPPPPWGLLTGLYLSTWHTKWGFTIASRRKISLTDVSQSNRRKNAHLGGCSGEFRWPAVLQSRRPLVWIRYFVFRGGLARGPPPPPPSSRINIKIRASLRHTPRKLDIRANPRSVSRPVCAIRRRFVDWNLDLW